VSRQASANRQASAAGRQIHRFGGKKRSAPSPSCD
jgi:hypothetical protein